ncbi:MAG: hypothetical protein Q8Q21_01455 [bacterium]|nr:hypothetical protein [bacterium]
MKKVEATGASAVTVVGNVDTPAIQTNSWTNVKNTAENTFQTISAKALEIKEYGLDGFAWMAANVLIDTFTDQIVDWINSGFEGSPMFLENPEQFFGEFGNQYSGAIIHKFNLYWLCDPWGKLNFELDLFLPGTSESRYKCTFEDVMEAFQDIPDINIDIDINQENIVREYGSDFRNGGWGMWLFTSNPKNNKAGAFGMAYNDAMKEAHRGQEQEKFGAQLGRGFLGIRQCVKYGSSFGEENPFEKYGSSNNYTESLGECVEYKTTTPGAIVQGKLDKTLGGDEGRLQVADEIDEVIGALATQFVSWIVTGGSDGGGLSSYTSSPDRAGNRDQYGALEDSQDANATKINLSEKISNMSKWEKKFKNSLEDMKSTLKERMEKLGEIANKLKCIQYGKDNRGDILNDNEDCADWIDEDSGDITDLNEIEVFKYVSLNDVELLELGKTCDDGSGKYVIDCEIIDIDEKIGKAESKLGYFESGGKYFDSDWEEDYIYISEWAMEMLENFDNDVLKAKSKKKINEIKKNYCFSNENYNANQEKGDICGEISGSEEFAVNIWAKETAVENGEDTYVYWYATGADYCEKEEGSDDNDWDMDFSESTSGSYRTKDFGIKDEDGEYESEEREYSITCYSEDGDYDTVSVAVSSYDDAEVVATVDITNSPSEVAFGKSSKLRWSASNVYESCYLYAEEKDYMEGLSGNLTRLDEDDEAEWMYSGEGYYLEVDASNYKGKETIEFEGEEGDSSYDVSYEFICQDADGEKFSDSVTISAGALGKEEYTTKGEKKAKEASEDASSQENKTKDQVEQYTCVLNKYTDNEDVDAKDCKDILADA